MSTRAAAAAFLAGVLGRLPALGGYWQGQEWALLGRASGLVPGGDWAAGPAGRYLLWPAGWALFGLDPDPWGWVRLGLHGACAALTVAIGRRAGLAPGQRLAAGLLMAASPVAFWPLYGASGLEILLGSCLALGAAERLLAGGAGGRLAALGLGALAALTFWPALATGAAWVGTPWGAWILIAYPLAAGASLGAAALLPAWRVRPAALLLGAVAAAALGWAGMSWRLSARDASGMPSDPLVRATAISWATARTLGQIPLRPGGDTLLLLSPPRTADQVEIATRLGRWVPDTPAYEAIGGAIGPRLLLPPGVEVRWAGDLLEAPEDAFVLADAGHRLVPWGRVPQALLYLAMDEVGRGQFRRARLHLLRGALLSGRLLPFASAAGLLTEPADLVRRRAPDFLAFLEDPRGAGASPEEVAALRPIFEALLANLAADGS